MAAFDIVSTLFSLGMLGVQDSKCVVKLRQKVVDEYMQKSERKRKLRIVVDEESLRWSPVISSQMLMDEERQATAEVRILSITIFVLRRAIFVPYHMDKLNNRTKKSQFLHTANVLK